ncbi:MBL fold metallo-hydrolase [Sphingobacterium siyangense]|uniref:ComEC/Rec2 family competence protein n=1 Tax=Sphingobacterium siyangense TaxID=459529 RepID=UPI002FDB5821
MKRNQTEFTILPAYHGDSILIKTFNEDHEDFIILIDGGTALTFDYTLKKQLINIVRIDLMILTHIDSDHIKGLIKFFQNSLIDKVEIGEIWMNHPEMVEVNLNKSLISVGQGDDLKTLITAKKPNTKIREISTDNKIIPISGLSFTILSPTPQIREELYNQWLIEREKEKQRKAGEEIDHVVKEDIGVNISSNVPMYSLPLIDLVSIPFKPKHTIENDIYNASSISFLLTCPDLNILLLADSRAEVISERLKSLEESKVITLPLRTDFVKVSHHGSLNNTSQELLSLIDSTNYLISTNGGTAKHKHPSRETIARIIFKANRRNEMLNIYTNYSLESIKNKIGEFINSNDLEIGNWNIEHKNSFTKDDIK